MFIVANRKIFYTISGLLVVLSLIAIFVYGLNLGIDFKGGSLLEVNFPDGRPEISEIREKIVSIVGGEPSIRSTGETGYILRMKSITESERQALMTAISDAGNVSVEDKRFDSIGPLLGKESAKKSIISIFLVILAIVSYIAFAFRKVSEPVASWKYGIIAIVALVHDVLIPTGVFAVLGHFNPTVEIDTLFVTALLVILGFSVHDTIVVFDRARENLRFFRKATFEETVGASISQTFTRSINTSLTVLLALVVMYFIGGDATRNFNLVLLIGVLFGTYSSIFLGSPLLVTVEKWQQRRKQSGKK